MNKVGTGIYFISENTMSFSVYMFSMKAYFELSSAFKVELVLMNIEQWNEKRQAHEVDEYSSYNF